MSSSFCSILILCICTLSIQSQTGFDTTSGCQFCTDESGRNRICQDITSIDSLLSSALNTYCSLSCSYFDALIDINSGCNCQSFICSTPAPITTDECIANCGPDIYPYCDSSTHQQYDNLCNAKCYGLTIDDVYDCSMDSTPSPITTQSCNCHTNGTPVCCLDIGRDHAGTHSNQCQAGKSYIFCSIN